MAKVGVSVGFTQNIGNFENIKTEIYWEGETAPDESHAEATDRLYAGLEEKFVEKAVEVFNTMSKDAQDKTKIRPEGA